MLAFQAKTLVIGALIVDSRAADCLSHFLDQRLSEGCKPKTLLEYRRTIGDFLRETGLTDPADLNPSHAVAWSKVLQRRGMKSGGIASTQRPVWSWFRWLYNMGYAPQDVSTRVKKARPKDVTRRTVTEDEKDAMVAIVAEHNEMPARDVAILELLYSTGLRMAELCGLSLADYDRKEGTVEVLGKDDKRRVVIADATARASMWGYLDKRGRNPGPLFTGRGGRGGLTAVALKHLIDKAAARAGVEVSAHDFRRACAANMLADGVGFDSVMYQLGHSTPTMTITYGQLGRQKRAHAEIKRIHAQRLTKEA